MLDVHAPHEAVHTWRDFFIHIATIVVGLVMERRFGLMLFPEMASLRARTFLQRLT